MNKLEKPQIEIHYFESDIITTSTEHDNGFIDSGELASIAKEIVEKIF